ncbi:MULTISPECIES: CCC motif membrane protein [Robiginitalea]|uniref:Uncharacterized protein n=1 Tax=Robiginitalea biformata (strain ATCC BAA-864 / DSM 15991 / KCTC 12146 / HTCC2501) TaxID=313596 RepID=A4CMV5_ROBBH|nr:MULTISPECIES: CCC motif membrane protein [Robiginitalea]EAR14997.1 hypothetical protein RB2501_11742 [Robiginitalea biformata HTCC2501]MDC6355186.1 CCC motif membrane protein [Robiginitalea sp. PM2]MDC6375599.1 CCC motif membrane protein [Robiginitalea sp. SP8]
MEQRKLPNVTLAIVLSILGYVCCCIWGLPAILLGVIAYLLLRSDYKKYLESPEVYTNYNQWKTARILAIIAIVLGVLYFGFMLFRIQQLGGWDAMMEQSREMMEQWGFEE